MESPGFVEEIEFDELQLCGVVGRGAFGVVSQARWRGIDVAVKLIETESEKKAFITELKQLSRVSHPNIVKLYGACTKTPVCLVMEYAEGGSLYNVLHGTGFQPDYTATHAMSWALQCAKGVEYLHSMKPKPLIHRDLKPPNLLLVSRGTVLKICDFGTACDAHTHMTNNKGSAAWMAPEVFEGNNYSEKCDVFSFGIILWEVLTRRKPFDEIGGPAFRIMWAVHNGTRPPLIKNCPKPLELLMTKCWSSNPVERPSMSEVVRIMTHLSQFFPGADEPLVYPTMKTDGASPTRQHPPGSSSVYDTPPMTNPTQLTSPEVRANTIRNTVREAFGLGEPVPIVPTTPRAQPVVVEEEQPTRTSAPASLAASRESLLESRSRSSTPSIDVVLKRYSADLTKLEEMEVMSQGSMNSQQVAPARGHRRTGSYGNSPSTTPINLPGPRPVSPSATATSSNLPHSHTAPGSLVDSSRRTPPEVSSMQNWVPGSLVNIQSEIPFFHGNKDAEKLAFIALDHQLQPLSPCTSSPESMAIFEEHCKYAREYMKLQMEIHLLTQKKFELMKEKDQDTKDQQYSQHIRDEYEKLTDDSESLNLLYNNLKKQLEMIRRQQPNQQAAGV